MDTRLLEYYNQELQYIREMGAEFAEAYPRIAARLGMDGIECADPYVERLIESFALLAARVQLKLDARHPEFTQHLLEMMYPHFLAPVPSCAVVELVPTPDESGLKEGYRVERGRALRTELATGERTSCEFRTAQDVVAVAAGGDRGKLHLGTSAFATPGLRLDSRVRAALRLGLSATQGAALRELAMDSLTFYIYATPDLASRVYEQVLANCVGVLVKWPQADRGPVLLPARAVRAVGFEDSEAMLPVGHRSFQGYRLLQEYFAFPDRYLFFSVEGLGEALRASVGGDVELLLLFDRSVPDLENALDATQFRLNCTPIINLFPRTLDRIHVTTSETEQHVVPDLSRPMDFEVFSVDRMMGFGSGGESIAEILPFYSMGHRTVASDARAYYTIQRRPRLASQKQRRTGARTNYIGSECFVSLVDSQHRDITGEIRQLEVERTARIATCR